MVVGSYFGTDGRSGIVPSPTSPVLFAVHIARWWVTLFKRISRRGISDCRLGVPKRCSRVPSFSHHDVSIPPLSTLELCENGDKIFFPPIECKETSVRQVTNVRRSFKSVCGSLALDLAKRPFDNVEMRARLDGDRGQCRRRSLRLLRSWLRVRSGGDGLIRDRQVTPRACVSPLSLVFAVFPEERMNGCNPQPLVGKESVTYRSYRIGSMGVAFSLNTLPGDSRVSLAWMIVAPSVCRFGSVGKGLSMINYYQTAWRPFERDASSKVGETYNVFPADAIFWIQSHQRCGRGQKLGSHNKHGSLQPTKEWIELERPESATGRTSPGGFSRTILGCGHSSS